MPLTDLALVWLGSVATLASIGMLLPRERLDRYVTVALPWVAALLWGNVGLAAFGSVFVGGTTEQTTMLPLAWLGVSLAMLAGLVGIYELVASPQKELEDADTPMDLGGGR